MPAAVWSQVHIILEGVGRKASLAKAFSRPTAIAGTNLATEN